MSDELRPCLRCGAKDEDNNIIGTVVEDNEGKLNYWIVCECGCAVNGYSQEEAEQLWNTRPVENELLRNIEQLRAKWDAIPWAAMAIHLRSDINEWDAVSTADKIVWEWFNANAPQEANR